MAAASDAGPADSPSLWLGLGVLALLGFVGAVFRLVFLNAALGIAAAAVLGAGAYYCLDRGVDLYRASAKRGPPKRPLTGRAREIALAPSFEVYHPGAPRNAERPDRFGPGR